MAWYRNISHRIFAYKRKRITYMKVWITRHGQTDLNKKQLMQGVYDEPLNETGIAQVI